MTAQMFRAKGPIDAGAMVAVDGNDTDGMPLVRQVSYVIWGMNIVEDPQMPADQFHVVQGGRRWIVKLD